jgi:hypothetical protein
MGTMHSHQEHEARREAHRWLEKQLTWEERLRQLHGIGVQQAVVTPVAPRRPAA